MKDLKKLHLKNAKVLSRNEMKQVFGGSGSDVDAIRVYDCLCYEINSDYANSSGTLPEPDKRFFIEANTIESALKQATAVCGNAYLKITCS